ncbi:hypothetical protein D3C72_1695500 [compost metagenome]
MAGEPGLHQTDFVLLVSDDALCQVAQFRIAGVEQQCLGHVDGALVMRDHHRDEVMIGLAVHGCGAHAGIHDGHGVVHALRERLRGAGDEGFRLPRHRRMGMIMRHRRHAACQADRRDRRGHGGEQENGQ